MDAEMAYAGLMNSLRLQMVTAPRETHKKIKELIEQIKQKEVTDASRENKADEN